MKKVLYLVSIIVAFLTNLSYAQIGLAVAKDSKGSVIKYQVAKSYSAWDAVSLAVNELKTKGYDNVSRCCGSSSLKSGYYVVLQTRYQTGSSKIVLALGASSSSYTDAVKKAKQTLYTNTSIYWSKNVGISELNRAIF